MRREIKRFIKMLATKPTRFIRARAKLHRMHFRHARYCYTFLVPSASVGNNLALCLWRHFAFSVFFNSFIPLNIDGNNIALKI